MSVAAGNKRDKDRESGTGQPLKSIPAKGGGGQGNWGSASDAIKDGINAQNAQNDGASRRRKRGKEPDSFADLNQKNANLPKQSWDEYKKKNKSKKGKTAIYNKQTVKSDYRKKYKANKYEKETDALFSGANKKKKNNRKKKKQKVVLQHEGFYAAENRFRFPLLLLLLFADEGRRRVKG